MKVKKKLSDMSKAEKARDFVDFVYNSRYAFSLSAIDGFYKGSIMVTVLIALGAFVGVDRFGFTFEILFPVAAIAIWHLFYWLFKNKILLKITLNQSTFEYKFLARGIAGFFFSSLFLLLFMGPWAIMKEIAEGFVTGLLLLLLYLISSVLYVGIVMFCVHKGVYKKAAKKVKSPIYLAISAFSAALIPVSGLIGLLIGRVLESTVSLGAKNILSTLIWSFLILCGICFHAELIAYYYCKKYKISCDESGNFTLPPPDEHNE